jgi:hypothetical protein
MNPNKVKRPPRLNDVIVLQVGVLGTGSYGQAVLVRRKSDGQKMVVKQIKIHGLTFEQRRDARNEVNPVSNLVAFMESLKWNTEVHVFPPLTGRVPFTPFSYCVSI